MHTTTADQAVISRNIAEYADRHDSMKWLTEDAAHAAARDRAACLAQIFSHTGAHWAYAETKLFTHTLSPGCERCGSGDWSCLFVNGICNAGCFYCPASQNEAGLPMTNTLTFSKPEDYAGYVNRFGIRGVSFSGGEPFLTFDRVISHLLAVKKYVDHPVYTWMYTNGLLVNRDKLLELRDHGLEEIRFDLSANRYKTDALKQAVGIIPRVTVEIPAIPEDLPVTKRLLSELSDAGVDHLNLHQIRCTPHNCDHLIKRGYTFLHGPRVTVLETEFAALALINHTLERSIHLPVNYCAFTYRHQFQGAGARRRHSAMIASPLDGVTRTGYLRHLTVAGSDGALEAICRRLSDHGAPTRHYSRSGNVLSIHAGLLGHIDFNRVRLHVQYSATALKQAVSYRHPFKEIALNRNAKAVIEKQSVGPPVILENDEVRLFGRMLAAGQSASPHEMLAGMAEANRARILDHEDVTPGLARYF